MKRNNTSIRRLLRKVMVGCLALSSALLIGGLGIFLILTCTAIIIGVGWNEDVNDIQGVQMAFWFSALGAFTTYVFWRLFRPRKAIFYIVFKRVFLVLSVLVLIGSSITTVVLYYSYSLQAGGCDIKTQLQRARSSVYAVDGDYGSGSAVAVSRDGKLLTAFHVIESNQNLKTYVTAPDGSLLTLPVRVLATSPENDLALLSLDKEVSYLELVESNEDSVGEEVYAVGFPSNAFEGGNATITRGIVSRLIAAKDIQGSTPDLQLIQTDAALNLGNSGGALVGECGVIGINDAISEASRYSGLPREEGISYAIDSQTAKKVFGL